MSKGSLLGLAKALSVASFMVVTTAGVYGQSANQASCPRALADVPGDYYDWRKTGKPERPFILPYHQTLVTKIFLAQRTPGDSCKVYLDFAQALEVIKRLDNITLGIPKVAYLVGWQHNGHDSKYPDWSLVNPHLKRPQDSSAVASLKWLIAEGAKHNTKVSLHINMFDAYAESPLWETYLKNDIIAKAEDGLPIKGEVQQDGGKDQPRVDTQSYYISYAREIELGFAQKRIDGLLAMLPELRNVGTIHIDAFHIYRPVPHAYPEGKYPGFSKKDKRISPYLQIPVDKEVEAQRKIYRYFRDNGIDVTSEGSTFLRPDAYIGLQPMAWGGPPRGVPADIYCGTPMRAEEEIKKDPKRLPGLIAQFCQRVVPWHYQNNPSAKNDFKIRDGDDPFTPALWSEKTIVAYSPKGYEAKTWTLPPGWERVKNVTVSEISPEGLKKLRVVEVQDGKITISLAKDQGVMIQPEGAGK